MALEVGQVAPDFTGQTHAADTVSLSALRGKVVVLFFYPKDDTPGCTKEACSFRDLSSEFTEAGAVVYGVSRDSVESHEKFARKYDLNIPLIADRDGRICEAYGVLKEKNMYGRVSIGIERTTFVIDREGKIAKIYPKVSVDGHADEVLETVRSL